MVRKLAGGTAGQLVGSEPCDEGGLGPLSDPMGRNKVKPEQASKRVMWESTRLRFGEGRVGQGSNRHEHLSRSAGVVGTARRKSGSGNRGRPVKGEGSGLDVA